MDIKYGAGTFAANSTIISKKCNQKCLDSIKRIRLMEEEKKDKDSDKEAMEEPKEQTINPADPIGRCHGVGHGEIHGEVFFTE
jgi:hypothetical protein